MRDISLAGVNLNSPITGISVTESNLWGSTEIDIYERELAQDDGSRSVDRRYKSRRFYIQGWIAKDNLQDFYNLIDDVKANANYNLADLVVNYGSVDRTFEVSITKIQVNENISTNFATYRIDFWAPKPYSQGLPFAGADTVVNSPNASPKTITSNFFTRTSSEKFTYDIRPSIVFVVNTYSYKSTASGSYLELGNLDNGYFLRLNIDFEDAQGFALTNGDSFIVDCDSYITTRNGFTIQTEGLYPWWFASNVNSNITFRTNPDADFQITYSVNFARRYL